MIKKQNLWFLTLFSLILVLSVYYLTMPSSLFTTNNGKNVEEKNVSIEESEILTALRIESEDERTAMRKEFNMILTNIEASVEDKNNAFEQLKLLDVIKGREEELEQLVKEKYKLNSFIKIDDNQIRIVVASDKHTTELANNIMRSIQEKFDDKMYISVKFQV
ncbi:MAG: SpoIIIAH-like family protein [Bacilli bacterium]|nr:SpoIIIAH-like family protein [Bacilli bacterium]MDD3305138.1 SpoIIIAH-like family protein [Bacilli bacterium]MDD4053678.1 SpoIIIAH-like family protein [Bacilli bacterium]MDD4411177.1 SpoIIIAH-like family protein [Bacilli bacterium]